MAFKMSTLSESVDDIQSPSRSTARQKKTNSMIQIITGDLAKEQADAIVTTVGPRANLTEGSVSYALLEAGGQSLQTEMNRRYPRGLKVGDVAETNGGSLLCSKVFYVVLKPWPTGHDSAEEVLQNVMFRCLEQASEQKFTSIAFPALGVGFFRFPGCRSAEMFFSTIENFMKHSTTSSLKTVKIVLHPRDTHTEKEFIAIKHGIPVVLENYLSKKILLSGFEVCVVTGCLSQLQADVLVNTTRTDLNLSIGAVSGTLLKKGGDVLQTECRRLCPDGLKVGQMVQTTGGALKCQKVFHVVLPRWNKEHEGSEKTFQSTVMSCLQKASRQGYKSIGFPVLGTGFNRYPPQISACLMHETFTQFLNENPTTSIQRVSVVVAHKDTVIKENVEWELESQGETSSSLTSSMLFGDMYTNSQIRFKTGDITMEYFTINKGSGYLPGEMVALKGREVKFFNLTPGQYRTNSIEHNHFESVVRHFYSSLGKNGGDGDKRGMYSVTRVDYVVNPDRIRKFRSAQDKMSQRHSDYATPVLAYHGTEAGNVPSICKEGFRQPMTAMKPAVNMSE